MTDDQASPEATPEGTGWPGVASRLAELARALQQQDNPQETLDEMVLAAVGTVPGAEQAGVTTIRERREVDTVAASDQLVHKIDAIQYETGQGPCLAALYDDKTVLAADLATEPRWPLFTERARDLGVGSMLSFQLFVAGDDLGALNLYALRSEAFDDESIQVGMLFATHAAVALAAAQRQQELVQALHTRDLIGQAKGILMERYKLTGDQAFALLTRVSQHTNTKLRGLAEELVTSGELSGLPPKR
ncbi:GAF and ANTAR domain-containing protein [Actinosynnema sp. CS-041913]|uniref:GAF and ANTAR domain-containing protein n=1 Tax=Actinosynnema sp. CS-041913 TaxID=3239917 RepID=UPI003D8DABE0